MNAQMQKHNRDALLLSVLGLSLLMALTVIAAHPFEVATRTGSGSVTLLMTLMAISTLSGICLVTSTILVLCDGRQTRTWVALLVGTILTGIIVALMRYIFVLGWALALMLDL